VITAAIQAIAALIEVFQRKIQPIEKPIQQV